VPYQTFKASDGWIIVACGNDGQWRRFCTIGGRPDLPDDPRFARVQDRIRNREVLVPLLEAMVAGKTQNEWIDEMERHGVPCGPINDFRQVFENPQVQARNMTIAIDRDDVGPVKMVANPIKASRTPPAYHRAPPRLGEHTDRVLKGVLGWDDAAVDAARVAGAIGAKTA
jgi:crotonobetainyl-CoA:carnitine CoA-transferase CaiB-like acyl-CoA transferase